MDETCLELGLGLGLSGQKRDRQKRDGHSKHNTGQVLLDLSISHIPSDNHATHYSSSMKINVGEKETRSVKNIITSNCSVEDADDTSFSEQNCSRKKLRLTRDQTNLLEDSFKQHCTLNMAQKHALAQQLKLKPRQVEVWFQNRRARTKLKQTELNCHFLKRNCERLNEENRRLKKELYELQSSQKLKPLPIFKEKCEACHVIIKTRGSSGGKHEPAAAAVEEVVREPTPNDLDQTRGTTNS